MHDSTLVVLLGSILVLPGSGTCQPCLRINHRPHGRLTCTRCLQGGGVHVEGGTVTLSSCTISGNTVRAHLQKFPLLPGALLICQIDSHLSIRINLFGSTYLSILVLPGTGTCQPRLQTSHRPDGKVADLLAPTHVCTTVNALRSTTVGAYCRDLEISHRPHRRLTCCSLFAGRRCLCQEWHSVHLIVHHQWEHCWLFYCTCQPHLQTFIAPMGKCPVDMSISILIFYDGCCLELPVWSTSSAPET
jgi:hypothetical protein